MRLAETLLNFFALGTFAPPDSGFTPELCRAVQTFVLPECQADEQALCQQFDQPDQNRKWREGNIKSSFNYLLLDPRSLLSPTCLFFFFFFSLFVFLLLPTTRLEALRFTVSRSSGSFSLTFTNSSGISLDCSDTVWKSLDVAGDQHLSPSPREK